MDYCCNNVGVPMNHIFPVKNYHNEIDTDDLMDVLILKALDQIVYLANERLRSAPTYKQVCRFCKCFVNACARFVWDITSLLQSHLILKGYCWETEFMFTFSNIYLPKKVFTSAIMSSSPPRKHPVLQIASLPVTQWSYESIRQQELT